MGMGMGIDTWEWEGTGIKNPFPNTSNSLVCFATHVSCVFVEVAQKCIAYV